MTMLRLTRSVPRAPRLLVKCQKTPRQLAKTGLLESLCVTQLESPYTNPTAHSRKPRYACMTPPSMIDHSHYTFLPDTRVLVCSRAWSKFSRSVASRILRRSDMNVKDSNALHQHLTVAYNEPCSTSPISQTSNQSSRQLAKHAEFRSSFCQSFIASSIPSSNVGAMQRGFTVLTPSLLVRMHLRRTLWQRWRQSLFIACDGMYL